MKAEPDFDLDYADGRQAELIVADMRESLTSGRVEVKRDRGFRETGNIYVEMEGFTERRGWHPTGIANPDTAATWIYELKHTGAMVVFETETLRRLVRHPIARRSENPRGDHPTRGVLLPMRRVFTPGVL